LTPKEFVDSLRNLKFENVFNPYSDICSQFDINDAPYLRASALTDVLASAAAKEIDSLWIGRDLGHRGGRRTGLALTDDVHLTTHAMRWEVSIQRATSGSPVAERTAAVIWNMLARVSVPVFLWNVFPFHPHEASDPFTNRAHNASERRVGEELLAQVILMLRPRRIVAIGNDATVTAVRVAGITEVIKVRHPSYGGQKDFVAQIHSLYDLPLLSESFDLKQI
jgi:hypothetical protein